MGFQSRSEVFRQLDLLREVEKQDAVDWQLVAQALLVELDRLKVRVDRLDAERQGARDLGKWLREQAARFDGG